MIQFQLTKKFFKVFSKGEKNINEFIRLRLKNEK